LDPRIQSKPYGEQILENLPKEIRTYRDIYEAVAAIGISD
jgi:Rad3-related DNA helicase